jgi:hypothetical protein
MKEFATSAPTQLDWAGVDQAPRRTVNEHARPAVSLKFKTCKWSPQRPFSLTGRGGNPGRQISRLKTHEQCPLFPMGKGLDPGRPILAARMALRTNKSKVPVQSRPQCHFLPVGKGLDPGRQICRNKCPLRLRVTQVLGLLARPRAPHAQIRRIRIPGKHSTMVQTSGCEPFFRLTVPGQNARRFRSTDLMVQFWVTPRRGGQTRHRK